MFKVSVERVVNVQGKLTFLSTQSHLPCDEILQDIVLKVFGIPCICFV